MLEAHQNLSLQVHPDHVTAQRLGGGARGKTECWFVLAAEPESRLYLGLDPEVDRSLFSSSAGSADLVDLVTSHPVRAGQFVFVPPGTVHAIGAGVTLVEIQENSDTTYRLFDWGTLRTQRSAAGDPCRGGLEVDRLRSPCPGADLPGARAPR